MIHLYKGLGDTSIVMGDNGSTPLWVAEDGSWGQSPVTIFDCHYWTAQDFQDLDDASDSDKVAVAKQISDEANTAHEVRVQQFIESIGDKAVELGIRMFQLTDEGMNELG